MLRDKRLHRVRERAVGFRPIAGPARVANGKRVDVVALARRGAGLQRRGFLHQLSRLRLVGRIHRRVDVGPEHERVSPVRHGKRRIQARGFGKRARRLGVVEAIREVDALIDEALGLGRSRRHRERVRAKILESRRERSGRRRLLRPVVLLVMLVGWRLRGTCRLRKARRGGEGQRDE